MEKGHSWANHMGATLAAEAARAVWRIHWQKDPALRAAHQTIDIPIREGDLCPAPTIGLGSGDFWTERYEAEKPFLAQMRRESPTVSCQIPAVRIGDLAIVANGGELFCQLALNIQQISPFKQTWIATLTNEYRGYIPTANAFYAGGYEVRTARSSYLAPDAGQKIVQTSAAVLSKLT
jgi:hypothetical protein